MDTEMAVKEEAVLKELQPAYYENDGDSNEAKVDKRGRPSSKPATLSLEEKMIYLKKLIDISFAYANQFGETLDPVGINREQSENKSPEKIAGGSRKTRSSGSSSSQLIKKKVRKNDPDVSKNINSWHNEDISDLFEGNLKEYQVAGFKWLQLLYKNAANGILADEMGLGKTIQTIAMITHLISKNCKGPYVVIAPLSTLPNWLSEFKKFCPKVPVCLFHGNADHRRKLIRDFSVVVLPNNKKTYPVIITSYETIMYEMKFFSTYIWKYLVVDEGHRLKNRNCKLVRLLSSIESMNRLLLTGTPLQNNLEELWSLLHFLTPEIFGNMEDLEYLVSLDDLQSNAILEQEMKGGILSKMHMALTPFILRRMKKDVNLNLPPKKEVLIHAPMSKVQWDLYNASLNGGRSLNNYLGKICNEYDEQLPAKRKCTKNVTYCFADDDGDVDGDDEDDEFDPGTISKVDTGSAISEADKFPKDKDGNPCLIRIRLQNPVFHLRKISNHPYLIQMPLTPKKEMLVNEDLIKKSGKFMILDALLPQLKKRGHKVLLFSTMTSLLDIIEEYIIYRDYNYTRLDGSVGLGDRISAISDYMTKDEMFLFLISTRAGSLGLNLTSADTVIIFDSDWNPQVDLQAQDRCHRIGQTKPVIVYRFVTTASIDEKIVEYAQNKRRLEKVILHNDCYKGELMKKPEVSIEELKAVLASKDYSKIVKTSATSAVFTKKELEDLLDRSDMC